MAFLVKRLLVCVLCVCLAINRAAAQDATQDPDFYRREAERQSCMSQNGVFDPITITCRVPSNNSTSNGNNSRGPSIETALAWAFVAIVGAWALQAYASSNSSGSSSQARQPAIGQSGFFAARAAHPNGLALDLRAGPDASHAAMARIPATYSGIKVFSCNSQDRSQAWCRVAYNDVAGWLPARHLHPDTDSARTAMARAVRRIENFLIEMHEKLVDDVPGIAAFYADRVDYYDKGLKSRDYIMREKIAVTKTCIARSYVVDLDGMKVSVVNGAKALLDVAYDVRTTCGVGKSLTTNDWGVQTRLDLSGADIRIVAQRGAVIRAGR